MDVVTYRQHMFGVTAGEHGVPGYEFETPDGEATNALYGLPLSSFVGVQLFDGAKVQITVRVLTPGKRKKNPWLKKLRGTRRD